ncbi:hypothetical protein K0M31_009853 [Melipona bicolor]|uniref:Uncharacterized protein n=1 Tax=Melipona bicolor TaxID=60889 RepID=A0AA40FMU8_9HYME|nr:hypothetical protein K0M31_009853 [Melipona bicolor]
MARGAWDTREGKGELALFYRKGLIALPITDNATINDLREVGLRNGEGCGYGGAGGWTERGAGMEIGTWSRMGMRLGIWEQVEVGACKRDNEESVVLSACGPVRACVRECVRTVKQERVDGPIGARRNEVHKVQRGLVGKGEARRWLATRAWMLVGSSGEPCRRMEGRVRASPFPLSHGRSVSKERGEGEARKRARVMVFEIAKRSVGGTGKAIRTWAIAGYYGDVRDVSSIILIAEITGASMAPTTGGSWSTLPTAATEFSATRGHLHPPSPWSCPLSFFITSVKFLPSTNTEAGEEMQQR